LHGDQEFLVRADRLAAARRVSAAEFSTRSRWPFAVINRAVAVDESVATDHTATGFGSRVAAEVIELHHDAGPGRIEHHHHAVGDPWGLR